MKYISMAIMATVLFFGSPDRALAGLVAGDKMPSLKQFRPLPGKVTACNGRTVMARIYPFHTAAAVEFYNHKHKRPYAIFWFTGLTFIDDNEDGIIDDIKKGYVPDKNCFEAHPWKNKPAPKGLEGVH